MAFSIRSLVVSAMFVVCTGTVSPSWAQAELTSQKRADIQKLMDLTGAGNIGVQAADQLIANMKTALPQVKDAFWVEFRKELSAEELIKLIIPLYDKHLTHPEIKELIKFYETPVGKKMIAVMPAITAESMQAGQQWGMDIAMRAKRKIEAQQKGTK